MCASTIPRNKRLNNKRPATTLTSAVPCTFKLNLIDSHRIEPNSTDTVANNNYLSPSTSTEVISDESVCLPEKSQFFACFESQTAASTVNSVVTDQEKKQLQCINLSDCDASKVNPNRSQQQFADKQVASAVLAVYRECNFVSPGDEWSDRRGFGLPTSVVVDHMYSNVTTLRSMPDAIGASECVDNINSECPTTHNFSCNCCSITIIKDELENSPSLCACGGVLTKIHSLTVCNNINNSDGISRFGTKANSINVNKTMESMQCDVCSCVICCCTDRMRPLCVCSIRCVCMSVRPDGLATMSDDTMQSLGTKACLCAHGCVCPAVQLISAGGSQSLMAGINIRPGLVSARCLCFNGNNCVCETNRIVAFSFNKSNCICATGCSCDNREDLNVSKEAITSDRVSSVCMCDSPSPNGDSVCSLCGLVVIRLDECPCSYEAGNKCVVCCAKNNQPAATVTSDYSALVSQNASLLKLVESLQEQLRIMPIEFARQMDAQRMQFEFTINSMHAQWNSGKQIEPLQTGNTHMPIGDTNNSKRQHSDASGEEFRAAKKANLPPIRNGMFVHAPLARRRQQPILSGNLKTLTEPVEPIEIDPQLPEVSQEKDASVAVPTNPAEDQEIPSIADCSDPEAEIRIGDSDTDSDSFLTVQTKRQRKKQRNRRNSKKDDDSKGSFPQLDISSGILTRAQTKETAQSTQSSLTIKPKVSLKAADKVAAKQAAAKSANTKINPPTASTLADPTSNSIRQENSTTNNPARKPFKKPPTISVTGVLHASSVREVANPEVTGNYEVRAAFEGIRIFPSDYTVHTNVCIALREAEFEFYSHDLHPFKSFRVALKGLNQHSLDELERWIQEAVGAKPLRITAVRSDQPHGLYLVDFKASEVNMSILKSVRTVYYYRVTWEPHRRKKNGITQCKNCCGFGHGEKNCSRLSVCLYCGEQHEHNLCPLRRGDVSHDELYQCINCLRSKMDCNHAANSPNCPSLAKYAARRTKMQTKQKDKNGTVANTVVQEAVQSLTRQSRPGIKVPTPPGPITVSTTSRTRSNSTPRKTFADSLRSPKGNSRRPAQKVDPSVEEGKDSWQDMCLFMADAYDQIMTASSKVEQRQIAFRILASS